MDKFWEGFRIVGFSIFWAAVIASLFYGCVLADRSSKERYNTTHVFYDCVKDDHIERVVIPVEDEPSTWMKTNCIEVG